MSESPAKPQGHVLDENWISSYEASPHFQDIWAQVQGSTLDWPEGVQKLDDKLYYQGKLVVPENLVHRVVKDFHIYNGHPGIKRMKQEIKHHFHFSPSAAIGTIVENMGKSCHICQACNPPNWKVAGPIESFPIPSRLMHHVSLDIFSMPPTEWQEENFDCILLSVDRLSGWITAVPTTKHGLTAERAAQLLLDRCWGPFGVPATVHSDQGPQFVGAWWRTICARLGVHQTFSQPHRPQANGRAERAGQQLLSYLRKLHSEEGLNWVEALPRALRLHHDQVGESGLSPYQIVFGRCRNLQGLPWTCEYECPDVHEFLDHVAMVDEKVAQGLQAIHAQEYARINAQRKAKCAFAVGAQVWVLKPATLSSQAKLQPRWKGPVTVVDRQGEATYVVQDAQGHTLQVHLDQLKPFVPPWEGSSSHSEE